MNFLRPRTIKCSKHKYIIITILCMPLLITLYFFGMVVNNDEFGWYTRSAIDGNFSVNHFIMPSEYQGKELPSHQVYESRKILLYKRQFDTIYDEEKTRTILLWTPWFTHHKTINYYRLQDGNESFAHYKCPVDKCVVTRDRNLITTADAVVFHLFDVTIKDLPKYRRSNQTWILYNNEPPWIIEKYVKNLTSLNGIFNITMSYRADSDVYIKYGLIKQVHSRNDDMLKDIWNNKTSSVLWIVSDCHTGSARETYVKTLAKYIDVDIYGLCGTKKCWPRLSTYCYDMLTTRYKFYLSFENAICLDYVTEKFFDVFNFNIIPVVLGGVDYSKLAPAGSYISTKDFPDPMDLAVELKKIGSDKNLYISFLKQKLSYRAFLDPWTCRLCEKLHTPLRQSLVENVKKWWISDAQCSRWDEKTRTFRKT